MFTVEGRVVRRRPLIDRLTGKVNGLASLRNRDGKEFAVYKAIITCSHAWQWELSFSDYDGQSPRWKLSVVTEKPVIIKVRGEVDYVEMAKRYGSTYDSDTKLWDWGKDQVMERHSEVHAEGSVSTVFSHAVGLFGQEIAAKAFQEVLSKVECDD